MSCNWQSLGATTMRLCVELDLVAIRLIFPDPFRWNSCGWIHYCKEDIQQEAQPMTVRHKRPSGSYEYAVTHIVISDEVADRLRRIAHDEGRKIQYLADRAIGEWLDQYEKQEGRE